MMFRLLPFGVVGNIGSALGALGHRLSRRRREVALANLRASYPEWTEEQCKKVVRGVYSHFGRSFAEFVRASTISPAQLKRLVNVEGISHLDTALAQQKGVLIITAHIGNWEMTARYIATVLQLPLCVVARDTDDPETTAIVNDLRARGGYEVYSRGNAARHILSALKHNKLIALLPDQNAADVFVPFFGRPCGSVTGPAVLHLRTGAPLLPAFSVRRPDGTHCLEIYPPIEYTPTGSHNEDVKSIMGLVHAEIERQVRRYPDQWLWLHDRWRTAREQFPEPAHVG